MRRRTYPERLTPLSIRISRSYMRRESAKWSSDVEEWVSSYLRRNNIPSVSEEAGEESSLRIDFPTSWRAKFFVLIGNKKFPYFEFH